MRRFLGLIPGIALLAILGYAGKVTEQSIARYGKAHHLFLPNIEYVLWAIVFGLIVANTIGVPKIFRPGVDTYEFWLKAGIVLLGVRFILGDVLKMGGISLACVAVELVLSLISDDLSGPRVSAYRRSSPACSPSDRRSAASPPSSRPREPSTPTMKMLPMRSPPFSRWARSACLRSRRSATPSA